MKKTNIKDLCLWLVIILFLSPLRVMAYSDGSDDLSSGDYYQEGANEVVTESEEDTQLVSEDIETFVTTPVGSTVPVLEGDSDYNQEMKDRVNSMNDKVSITDTRLYTATKLFNCHSYAWYSQDVLTNRYWMDDPTAYYSDGSYYEVFAPMVGDIICYFDDGGTPGDFTDDENLHSGIVVVVSSGTTSNGLCGNSNIVTVESKWADGGLYRHNGYECPYTDHILETKPYIGERARAEYVKFYRRTGHTHSFTEYNDTGNEEYHECECDCGMVIHAPHEWVLHWAKGAKYIPEYYCTDCNAFTLNPRQPTI